MIYRLAVIVLALALFGCGEELPTAVEPSPSPSPSPVAAPTPDPCTPLRTDITAEVKGSPAFAWGLGQVATLTASIVWAEGDPALTAACPQLNSVEWRTLHVGDPLCNWQGVLNAKSTRLVCSTSGWGLVRAAPQGYDVRPGDFAFRVLSPEALRRYVAGELAVLWEP